MQTLAAPRATVLVVDDTPAHLALTSEILLDHYDVRVASSGARALEIARARPQPDLVLLDVMMPGMDGYEVCRRLKSVDTTRDLPVVFVTARTEVEDERQALALGGADYVSRPFSPEILLARVGTQLRLKAASDLLRGRNEFLEVEVRQRMREVSAVQDVSILAMAALAETRDNETGNHIHRTRHYVQTLALELRSAPGYAAALTPEAIEVLCKSAPLHDIGKIGIPDSILKKPGRLTADEFAIMRTHATIGRDAIAGAERALGTPDSFLRYAREIAGSHHEKWDGSGYPDGLAGERIPLSARLMALADVYDALISRRVYKAPMTHDEARAYIVAQSGVHFDPAVVQAFLATEAEFVRIAAAYSDELPVPA